VVVYFRALCAVSREELERPAPRLASLRRLVQCAHDNTGERGDTCLAMCTCHYTAVHVPCMLGQGIEIGCQKTT
jgi:hypothetical protein